MLKLTAFLLALAIVPITANGQAPSPGGDPIHLLRLATSSPRLVAEQLESLHYDVAAVSEEFNYIEVVASQAEELELQSSGFNLTLLEVAQPLLAKLSGGIEIPTGYRNLNAIYAQMTAVAGAYPSIAQVINVSASYGPGTTQEGRSIMALKISDNVGVDENEPNILIAALHHAREIVTPEICLDHIDRLLTAYGIDANITAIIDNNEIWVIPVVNPDGLEFVWTTNNLWRKNRAPQAGGAIGVDLNRNYNLGWNSSCSGATNPNNDTFKGTAPFSEIETATIRDFSRSRRFAKVLDLHSSGREVLLGYYCSTMPLGPDLFIDAEGQALALLAGYQTRPPSADGEHQQWQIKTSSCYSFLAETELSFQPPYAYAALEATTLWPLTLGFLEREIPVVGNIVDQVTGSPIDADIEVLNLGWTQGETRVADLLFGRYHLFLAPGNYQVRYTKTGYVDQTLAITVPGSGTVVQNVNLVSLLPDVGQANRPTASLIFSGAIDIHGQASAGQNGPFFASYAPGAAIVMDLAGPPTRPLFLLNAGLNRNNAVGTVGSLDIGFLGTTNDFSDLAVVLNGVAPVTFFDQLAFLSAAGTRSFVVPAPPFSGLQLGAFQAWIHQDLGLPLLTAATEISVQ